MAKLAASCIVNLVLRVFVFVLLLISLILICTNTTTAKGTDVFAEQDFRFQDVIAYRYMLSSIVIGTAFVLLQLAFTIYNVIAKSEGNLLFDFYGDKIMSYVLATGAASGFGVTNDMQMLFNKLNIFLGDDFYAKSYASASLLLLATVCTAVLSVFSSYALIPKTV
ncbi:hypothetical protein L484_009956 [Morus notabilis]|uniref:CASP-like protein n=1 Tax=Morus notabilis TaxID=981085 RepID=W9SGV0_9ROSA|nr:CASP-like protein 4D1 [Morus notabilis]EXC06045.1 hypothetical protein L484_009956 [Morus notabilis]